MLIQRSCPELKAQQETIDRDLLWQLRWSVAIAVLQLLCAVQGLSLLKSSSHFSWQPHIRSWLGQVDV